MPKKRGSRKPYHHGALRETLLGVAGEILAERGVEGFTMRECARRADVSHAAPAHHFGDVNGLLSELAASSFEELDALMTRYRREGPADGYHQFVATGLAYVDYALEHRARFQLMFRSNLLDFGNDRLASAGARTYAQLVDTLAALPAPDGDAALPLDERVALAWSIVHGVAVLMLDNELFAQRFGRAPKRTHDAVSRMLLASQGVFDGGAASTPTT